MKILFVTWFFLIHRLFLFGQSDTNSLIDVTRDKSKISFDNSFFWDASFFQVNDIESIITWVNQSYIGVSQRYFGGQIRFGNTWYTTTSNRFNGFIKMTWLGTGLSIGDGVVLVTSPLHPGIGCNFRLTETSSVDLSVNGGLVILGPGILDNEVDYTCGFYPQLKFNLDKFIIGLEYTKGPINLHRYSYKNDGHYSFLRLSIGAQF